MSNEYLKSNRKQKKLLAKYSKLMKKVAIGISIGLLGMFALPHLGISSVLLNLLPISDYAAVSIDVWLRILITAFGTISAAVNGIKAHGVKNELENSMDDEEDIVSVIELEKEKNSEKAKDLEHKLIKTKNKETESNSYQNKSSDMMIENYDKVHLKEQSKRLKK